MVCLFLADGRYLEEPNAVRVQEHIRVLVCYDAEGQIIRTIDVDRVTGYTNASDASTKDVDEAAG